MKDIKLEEAILAHHQSGQLIVVGIELQVGNFVFEGFAPEALAHHLNQRSEFTDEPVERFV